MSLIGLELNDAGILAVGGSPPGLLELDGQGRESPGFALPQKSGLLVGKTAERKAHLFPRQILTRFWDQLNTEPLEQTGKYFPLNHAEIVYRHLSLIWQQIQSHGDQIVMAVPNFYEREHLGLLLGIAQELGMPVKGFPWQLRRMLNRIQKECSCIWTFICTVSRSPILSKAIIYL